MVPERSVGDRSIFTGVVSWYIFGTEGKEGGNWECARETTTEFDSHKWHMARICAGSVGSGLKDTQSHKQNALESGVFGKHRNECVALQMFFRTWWVRLCILKWAVFKWTPAIWGTVTFQSLDEDVPWLVFLQRWHCWKLGFVCLCARVLQKIEHSVFFEMFVEIKHLSATW